MTSLDCLGLGYCDEAEIVVAVAVVVGLLEPELVGVGSKEMKPQVAAIGAVAVGKEKQTVSPL